jgi:hypothetical protein
MAQLPEFPDDIKHDIYLALLDAQRSYKEQVATALGWQRRHAGPLTVDVYGPTARSATAALKGLAIEIVKILAGACRSACASDTDFLAAFPAISEFAFLQAFPRREDREATDNLHVSVRADVCQGIADQLSLLKDALNLLPVREIPTDDTGPGPSGDESPCTDAAPAANTMHGGTDRSAAVDRFLQNCSEETTLKPYRKYIWQAAGHTRPRQFQFWQASNPKATAQDDQNFRRILAMRPTDFEALLKRKGFI